MTSTSTDNRFYYTSTPPTGNWASIQKSAMESLKKQITEEVFRESPLLAALQRSKAGVMRNEELRRCIGDAYDKHVNEDTPKEANNMNEAVAKVMAERAEDRAREALVALDEYFEEYEVGSCRSWTVQFDASGKVYNYAAVFAADGLWYVTNRTGGVKPEVLKMLLTEWAVEALEVLLDGTTVL